LAAGYAVLWFAARPAGQPAISYLGQFFGAECVLLLSVGLVLISTLPWVEIWFDGIDRAAIWHRRVAITGLPLLVPHILLAANSNKSSLGPPLAVIGAIGAAGAVQADPLARQYYGRPPLREAILLPAGAQQPARKYLDWHRQNIFSG